MTLGSAAQFIYLTSHGSGEELEWEERRETPWKLHSLQGWSCQSPARQARTKARPRATRMEKEGKKERDFPRAPSPPARATAESIAGCPLTQLEGGGCWDSLFQGRQKSRSRASGMHRGEPKAGAAWAGQVSWDAAPWDAEAGLVPREPGTGPAGSRAHRIPGSPGRAGM